VSVRKRERHRQSACCGGAYQPSTELWWWCYGGDSYTYGLKLRGEKLRKSNKLERSVKVDYESSFSDLDFVGSKVQIKYLGCAKCKKKKNRGSVENFKRSGCAGAHP